MADVGSDSRAKEQYHDVQYHDVQYHDAPPERRE
jgi:hypothetical protein